MEQSVFTRLLNVCILLTGALVGYGEQARVAAASDPPAMCYDTNGSTYVCTGTGQEFKPLVIPYEREYPYRGPSGDYRVKNASFVRVLRKIIKFSLNPHLAESRRILVDTRAPRRTISETLTDYAEVLPSPDGKTIAFLDLTENPWRYRLNAYDLSRRTRSVVFESGNQINYFVWLSDSTLFVQFDHTQPRPRGFGIPGIVVTPHFSWLERDGSVLLSRAVPQAIPIVDAAAIAYTSDGRTYLRYDRTTGEKPWFLCRDQTEFKVYNPPNATVLVRGVQAGKEEIRFSCQESCVGQAGWEALPRLLKCGLE